MSNLIGGRAPPPLIYGGLQINSSVVGTPIAKVYGVCRIGVTLIWWGAFASHKSNSRKIGDLFGSSGTTYSVSAAMALCAGPVYSIGNVWQNNSESQFSSQPMSWQVGDFPQTPWSYLTAFFPGQDIPYNGLAYAEIINFNIGSSASLPNFNFEVRAAFSNFNGGSGTDADPSLVVTDILTNEHDGAGFPAAKLGDLTNFRNYCLAQGLMLSAAYTSQQQTSSVIDDLAKALNCAVVWTGGLLNLIPYGDQTITGNGVTFTPDLTPLITLTTDDFVPDANSSGQSGAENDPVVWTHKRPADMYNDIKVQYADNSNAGNLNTVEVRNQALIDVFGIRAKTAGGSNTPLFRSATMAYLSASLQLQREQIANTCTFATDARYGWLDCMDIIAVPDGAGDNVSIRITSIVENDDDTFSFQGEEVVPLAGTAVLNAVGIPNNNPTNTEVTPPSVNTPLIFEPPVQLVSPPLLPQNTPEVWFVVSATDPLTATGPTYGGANVFYSLDNVTYYPLGAISGQCTMGGITANVPSYGGANPDTVSTVSLDLTESNGALDSATDAVAQAGGTLSLLINQATSGSGPVTLNNSDPELFTYVDATSTGAYTYDLTRLYRALYGSPAASFHASGTVFGLLDGTPLVWKYPIELIGATVYFKFQAFNPFGGGVQSLAACTAYAYKLLGSGMFGPVSQLLSISSSAIDEGLASSPASPQYDDEGLASDIFQVVLDEGLASQ